MLELAEARSRKSMIFCTQYEPVGWYERINSNPEGDSPVSEAIMDRIINNAYKNFNRAGSSRRLTPAYPGFWVFSDCTFLDNSIFRCFPRNTGFIVLCDHDLIDDIG